MAVPGWHELARQAHERGATIADIARQFGKNWSTVQTALCPDAKARHRERVTRSRDRLRAARAVAERLWPGDRNAAMREAYRQLGPFGDTLNPDDFEWTYARLMEGEPLERFDAQGIREPVITAVRRAIKRTLGDDIPHPKPANQGLGLKSSRAACGQLG